VGGGVLRRRGAWRRGSGPGRARARGAGGPRVVEETVRVVDGSTYGLLRLARMIQPQIPDVEVCQLWSVGPKTSQLPLTTSSQAQPSKGYEALHGRMVGQFEIYPRLRYPATNGIGLRQTPDFAMSPALIRLECLKLAFEGFSDAGPDEFLKVAASLGRWINENNQ